MSSQVADPPHQVVMVVPITAAMTGLMLIIATGILRMDAPYPWLLWLVGWLAAVSVAEGTVVLFAVLRAPGQLLAMLPFVYAALRLASCHLRETPGEQGVGGHVLLIQQAAHPGQRGWLYLATVIDIASRRVALSQLIRASRSGRAAG